MKGFDEALLLPVIITIVGVLLFFGLQEQLPIGGIVIFAKNLGIGIVFLGFLMIVLHVIGRR